ncbi:MAG: hypothetical protein R2724_09870 [Bryobacterales bacterium]
MDAHPEFERMAPTLFSLVCLRARPADVAEEDLDGLNERLMEAVNASGEFFLSHTRLNGKLTIRVAIGNLRTRETDVQRLWELIQQRLADATGA